MFHPLSFSKQQMNVYLFVDVYLLFCILLGKGDVLNGSKVLIKGNHDDKNLKCSTRLRRAFLDIRTYDEIRDGDKIVVLFHYPIDQWDGYYRGYVHVNGHTHGDSTLKVIPGRYEACVEVTDYTPLTLKELMKNN